MTVPCATPYVLARPGMPLCARIALKPSAAKWPTAFTVSSRSRPLACPYTRTLSRDRPPSRLYTGVFSDISTDEMRSAADSLRLVLDNLRAMPVE